MTQILSFVSQHLLTAQVICLILATFLILLQNRGSGLSASFGGSSDVYLTRRGIEKWVVNLSVFFIVLFVILRVLDLYI